MNINIRYTIVALLFFAASLWLSEEIIPALLWSGVLAIALWPIHQKMQKQISNEKSALYMTLIAALVIVGPLSMIGIKAAGEYPDAHDQVINVMHNGINIPTSGPIGKGFDLIKNRLPKNLISVNDHHIAITDGAFSHINSENNRNSALSAGSKIGKTLAHLSELAFFMLLGLYAFLYYGKTLIEDITVISTKILGEHGPILAAQMARATRGSVVGMVLVGLLEGALSIPILLICSAPHALLFSLIIGIAAIIPFLSYIVLPLCALFAFIAGVSIVKVIIILAGPSLIVFLCDHMIKPKLVGNSTQMNFLPTMIAILGGIHILGLVGLFVGPAIISTALLIWRNISDRKIIENTHNKH